MVTLADVARAAGVSRSAVSKALLGGGGKTTKVSEKTVVHIRSVAEKLGYRPNLLAQQLAKQRQDVIGLIVDSECCFLFSSIMQSIERLTNKAGFRLQVGLVHDNYNTIKRYVDDFLGYNIQSVICLAHYYGEDSKRIPALFKPFKNPLFINKPMSNEPFSFVSPDFYSTFYEAMEYLFKLNRRRVVFLKTVYSTYDAQMREQAFRDAHLHYNIPYAEAQIYREPVYECDTPELVNKLLDDVLPLKPDALILGCSQAIMLTIRELRRRNLRVPEDISIIGMEAWNGFDAVIPSITVMDNNPQHVAEAAVKAILANMQSTTPETHEIFIPGGLFKGESCCEKA